MNAIDLVIPALQRALKTAGVGDAVGSVTARQIIAAMPAQLYRALAEMEAEGVTLAPCQLTPELRRRAVAAAHLARSTREDWAEAFWAAAVAHALPALRESLTRQAEAEPHPRSPVDA